MSAKSQNNNVFIRRVILENFLSFKRDEVDFENNKFILIVGPNWSGKTSIFQAIKFALGSNERDERYKKWSNFIRHGQKHAMVELEIQNGEDLINIRRNVIKGQSPFFLIKKNTDTEYSKVHATEIQNLISDLNYNPDNHFAFVSQGKIDAIKSLKPTELCNFLEEGIGLKGLRDEILQQKHNVFNLNTELKSLRSKKNVLNISLDLLQPKLERLEEKHKLVEIKRNYEDELLWANRKKLKEEIKYLERDFSKLKVEIDEIKSKKDEIDKEVKKFEILLSKTDKDINRAQENLGKNKQKRTDLIAKIQKWHQEEITIKQDLDNLSQQISKEKKILENHTNQKKSLDHEIQLIKDKLDDIELNIENLIKEQTQLLEKIKLNSEFVDHYNQIIREKDEKQKNIQDNKIEINAINDEINQIFQSFKDIEHKLDKNKWFLENPTKSLLKQLDSELMKTNSAQYSINTKKEQLERERFKKLNNLKLLQEALRKRRVIYPQRSNIEILKDEIKKRDLKVKGPIIEYLKYDDHLSYAIESVLGERLLYSFIAENWETMTLLKRLRENYNTYCNIYVPRNVNITKYPEISAEGVIGYLVELINIIGNDQDIKKVIYSKIKNCIVVKDYHSGVNLYNNNNFKGKCVTLKGEQIISYRYVYETPHIKSLKGLLSAGTQKEQANILDSEIKSLNEQILNFEVRLSKLDEQERDLLKKKETYHDLSYIFNQKQRLTAKKNDLYEQRAILEKENSNISTDIKDLNVKIKEIQSKTDPHFFKWNERIKEIPNELTIYTNEKKNWSGKLKENQKILKEVEIKQNSQNQTVSLLNQQFEEKNEDLKKRHKDAYVVYNELGKVETKISQLDSRILEFNEKKIQIQESKKELDIQIIQINVQLEQENVNLNYIRQKLEGKKEDLERINSQIGPLISENKIKIRPIEEIQQDMLKVDKDLMKFLDVDDSLLIERDQLLTGLKEIAKNQKDIEADIKAAMKTEDKMEETYYNKFENVLNDLKSKINRKFRNSEIKAYCSLELIGDFENLGVEIKAALSKSHLRSCSALSGGQVSMISICLILSLQELKPSPLCMLDEAAMFLDDKNSEVAYQMIKSTLKENPNIQMILFLPKSSNVLYLLAEKLIGVARTGKDEVSTIFKPKVIKKD
ncbi:MAG: chromosome segregation protein SMC [Promethearchaeota archaeon]|nr:MAG: chromosome segregation protein SMC [Candidatus Lokiarchaeota archaeon]